MTSGLVDYQSEKLNFGLYILHSRARSAIANSSRNICKCIVKDLESQTPFRTINCRIQCHMYIVIILRLVQL